MQPAASSSGSTTSPLAPMRSGTSTVGSRGATGMLLFIEHLATERCGYERPGDLQELPVSARSHQADSRAAARDYGVVATVVP